jgi:hypothetical protein
MSLLSKTKRVLNSLALGLLIIPLLWVTLLIMKLFSPGIPSAFGWIFLWTYPLYCRIPYVAKTTEKMLLFGLLCDYVILSLAGYAYLRFRDRLFKRRDGLDSTPSGL